MSKFRLDEVDHQILDMLIDNTRNSLTLPKIINFCWTVHVRVKKMEDAGIIMGSSVLDYDKLDILLLLM
jgi:Lrp/AsnC family transcriptional regulator for asnA, asnC and gidA